MLSCGFWTAHDQQQPMLLNLNNCLWRGYLFYHFGIWKNSMHVVHVITFFSSLKTNPGRSVCHFEENFLSGRFFSYSCFFLLFIVIFNLFPIFSRGRPRIESQQRHFEESVIICVERTWPIKHLSNHESFVPNHVGPLSSDFFFTNDNVPKN